MMRRRIRAMVTSVALAATVLIPTSTAVSAAEPHAAPTAAATAWALQKSCPSNTHLVIHYKIKANKNGGLWVGRSLDSMFGNNVQVDYSKPYVRSKAYDTHMNGHVYWGHGSGSWTGSIVDASSYGVCAAGV